MYTFKPKQKPDARTRNTAKSGPALSEPHGPEAALLHLQRSVGNQAVGRLLQTKLTVGAPGDRYEQEADRAAEQVTNGAETQVQRSSPAIQPLASDAQGAEPAEPGLESQLEARRGQGNPLPSPIRAEMEGAFDADFGAVRLHADGEAAQMSRGIHAEAFTYGSDIYLGQGGLDTSSQGRRLLAHELTHTIQQGAVQGGGAGRMVSRRMIQRSCHTVQANETLFAIAKKYGVTVEELRKANGMDKKDSLALGKVLTVPDGKACVTAPAVPATPAAATPAAAPAATPAAPELEAGHEAGKDYSSGTLRERATLHESDKKKTKKSAKKEMFFEKGDTVSLISSDKDWVEVKGTAFVLDKKTSTSVGEQSGWIPRSATTMTLGDYKDLKIEDLTGTYGGLSSGGLDKADVNNVILHRTGGSTGASALSGYASRIKAGSSIGAQYLIDESGNIKLVVPVNREVSHVGKQKPGFATASSAHAVGIEHVGTASELDVPSSTKDATTLAANRTAITAMSLTPELKARVLALSDKALFQLARDNRLDGDPTKWQIYGDINAAQKRSSFLLANQLMTDFGLAEADLLPHETASWKTIGEGENIKEVLSARIAYPGLVTQLEAAINGDATLKSNADLVKILDAEKATVAALALDATESENKDLAAETAAKKPGVASAREDLRVKFYDKLWDRHAQIKDLVSFLKTSGSANPTELAKKIAAWKS
ncbi:MAG: hypothetical protein QOH06_3498 [Acidobacteriota bacterium]|nr:hypothetical protein [Acidobacteriota bacterium]